MSSRRYTDAARQPVGTHLVYGDDMLDNCWVKVSEDRWVPLLEDGSRSRGWNATNTDITQSLLTVSDDFVFTFM